MCDIERLFIHLRATCTYFFFCDFANHISCPLLLLSLIFISIFWSLLHIEDIKFWWNILQIFMSSFVIYLFFVVVVVVCIYLCIDIANEFYLYVVKFINLPSCLLEFESLLEIFSAPSVYRRIHPGHNLLLIGFWEEINYFSRIIWYKIEIARTISKMQNREREF